MMAASADLEPAPTDLVVDDPLSGAPEAEAVDVEAEGGFHVGDHEEGDGLFYVRVRFQGSLFAPEGLILLLL